MRQKAGRFTAAGLTRDVTFETVDRSLASPIDSAYRAMEERRAIKTMLRV